LHDWIAVRLARDLSGADFPAVTRERHRRRLAEALIDVEAARRALDHTPEMAGDDLRRPRKPWAGSPARSASRTFWAKSSRPSASASDLFHVKHDNGAGGVSGAFPLCPRP
jgi:hypothetical protein